MLLLLHRLAGRLRQSCAGVPSGARCRACRTRVRPRVESFRCLLSVSTTKRPLSPGPSEREAFSRVERRYRRLSGFEQKADGRSLRSRCDCQSSNPVLPFSDFEWDAEMKLRVVELREAPEAGFELRPRTCACGAEPRSTSNPFLRPFRCSRRRAHATRCSPSCSQQKAPEAGFEPASRP